MRAVALTLALTIATLIVFVVSLSIGRFVVPPEDVIEALLARGDGMARVVVVEWRLGRVSAAVVFGAALGAAGAIFQSLTRNPLGSPDVIGFSTGAYTGALLAIVFLGGSFAVTAFGAVVGGALTATVVYLVAFRTRSGGFGIIIVGIAIAAVLSSVNTWILLTARLEVAVSAAVWGMGSLNGVQWDRILPAFVLLVAPLSAAGLMWRRMQLLEMGDDTAHSLGIRAERTRLMLIVCGVGITAIVTAVIGPVAFVALSAPQIARRLTGTPSVSLLPSAVTGALLLASADIIAQHAFGGDLVLPVGVVTVSLGGCYLVWLIFRDARKRARR
ncbi:iron-enterobactin ABC transporter permease [Leucobacter sp. wl10]|nr:iron-enterobactin ABC transporter permease [Leucobacter sp. wl10]